MAHAHCILALHGRRLSRTGRRVAKRTRVVRKTAPSAHQSETHRSLVLRCLRTSAESSFGCGHVARSHDSHGLDNGNGYRHSCFNVVRLDYDANNNSVNINKCLRFEWAAAAAQSETSSVRSSSLDADDDRCADRLVVPRVSRQSRDIGYSNKCRRSTHTCCFVDVEFSRPSRRSVRTTCGTAS